MSKLRRAILRGLDFAAGRLGRGRPRLLERGGVYAFDDYRYEPQPRFGVQTPPLPWLQARLEHQSAGLEEALRTCAAYGGDYGKIALEGAAGSPEPHWLNSWMDGIDPVWLYCLLRAHAPAQVIEIGSGNSTKFMRRAIKDGGLATRIISIDPHPRAEIDQLCDEIHRSPLEKLDLSVFDSLKAGDVLFFDGSHRLLQNSDVAVFFLEVLPRVPAGVLVGVHDIFLPYDYPESWTDRLYNEQHVLAAYLLGRPDLKIAFASHWMSRNPRLAGAVEALFPFDPDRRIQRDGGCFFFWM